MDNDANALLSLVNAATNSSTEAPPPASSTQISQQQMQMQMQQMQNMQNMQRLQQQLNQMQQQQAQQQRQQQQMHQQQMQQAQHAINATMQGHHASGPQVTHGKTPSTTKSGGPVNPMVAGRTLLELPSDRALSKETAFEVLAQGSSVIHISPDLCFTFTQSFIRSPPHLPNMSS